MSQITSGLRAVFSSPSIYDWFQDLGEAADWSTGLMGMPFDTAGYAGRAHGDPSEGLLGDRWTPEMDDATE